MTRYVFEEVSVRPFKKGLCAACGKPAERTGHIYQTLNPFNLNADGVPKSRREILAELAERATAWGAEPIYHARCEPKP